MASANEIKIFAASNNSAPVFEVTVTNNEERRTDVVPVLTRMWPLKTLRDEYIKIILGKNNYKLNERYFEFTDVVFKLDGVLLDNEKSLAHYKIRPNSKLISVFMPKIKIRIKHQSGRTKSYEFFGTADMTIFQVKDKYARARFKISPHDWTAEEMALLDKDGLLVRDEQLVSEFIRGFPRDQSRGWVNLNSNYVRNGFARLPWRSMGRGDMYDNSASRSGAGLVLGRGVGAAAIDYGQGEAAAAADYGLGEAAASNGVMEPIIEEEDSDSQSHVSEAEFWNKDPTDYMVLFPMAELGDVFE